MLKSVLLSWLHFHYLSAFLVSNPPVRLNLPLFPSASPSHGANKNLSRGLKKIRSDCSIIYVAEDWSVFNVLNELLSLEGRVLQFLAKQTPNEPPPPGLELVTMCTQCERANLSDNRELPYRSQWNFTFGSVTATQRFNPLDLEMH